MLILTAVVSTIHIDSEVLAVASGTVIPFLTHLIAKDGVPEKFKIGLNALLSAIAGVLASVTASGGTVVWKLALLNIGLAWATTMASHMGLHLSGLGTVITTKTARIGFGRRLPVARPPSHG